MRRSQMLAVCMGSDNGILTAKELNPGPDVQTDEQIAGKSRCQMSWFMRFLTKVM